MDIKRFAKCAAAALREALKVLATQLSGCRVAVPRPCEATAVDGELLIAKADGATATDRSGLTHRPSGTELPILCMVLRLFCRLRTGTYRALGVRLTHELSH
jgi:hypothetical protein